MIRISSGAWRRLAGAAIAAAGCAFLAACGSGAVSDPATINAGGLITITPASATLYSDLPTTFVITGGNGSYLIASSDQAVLPVVGTLNTSTLTVVPSPVGADTPVTLTVRDTGSSAPATASLTVKPRTISNTVTITPSASQSAACGSSICSGGDAEVKAVLTQGGSPLVGRAVRFDVVSGDIRIITSPPGAPETLALSGTTSTDNTGSARMRVRVLADATAQTALLQITDVASGSTQRTSVSIAPASNAPLNAQPATIVFQGVDAGTCASGISADVIVFGGRPPYLISQPGSFSVSPTVVIQNGGRFTVAATGQCSAGSQIAVVDGNGATVSVTASNKLSDLPVPTPTAPFNVSPSSGSLSSCASVANFTLSGGSGTYIGTASDARLAVTVSGNLGSVQVASGQTFPGATSANVIFSDGKSSVTVPINITGAIAPACP